MCVRTMPGTVAYAGVIVTITQCESPIVINIMRVLQPIVTIVRGWTRTREYPDSDAWAASFGPHVRV